jgi:DNA polymerase-3 subunit alpha
MNSTFVHLHLHTEYSLVDGLIPVKALLKQVQAAAMPAVAVTDLSNLFAAIKFYKAAQSLGIKPIIGADVWVQRNTMEPTRLVLLCQNTEGYRNLIRLISQSHLEGQQRGVPMLEQSWLYGATEGLIALSGGREGEIGRTLLHGQETQAKVFLEEWQTLFPERFYLELQRTGREQEENYIEAAVELASSTGTPVVATNDVRFLEAADFDAHEARVCIQEGHVLADPRRPHRYSHQQYLRTPSEMAALFGDLPEALANSLEIARRCNLHISLGENFLPDFPIPAGFTAEEFFISQAQAGLQKRLQKIANNPVTQDAIQPQAYHERLTQELSVINQMGFAGYFLIVADFIQWARQHGVPVGPGRGSGAGSLVAFALGITDLDPLAHDLLFERFLNPERVSMPDFDIDFCMEGRDRVIDYVAQRYGRDKVAQIATHGTMAAKAVVRDVGRVLSHPYGFVDRIAKLIPFKPGVHVTLEDALDQEAELRRLYTEDEEVKALIDLARPLEGLARSVGKHAGGVVIAPSALADFSPLYCEQDSEGIVTQYDKDDVEIVGLVKFDFLGLRTLTIIDWAVQAINRQRAISSEALLDITAIAMDDAITFDLLKACQTTAVFQLESRGMKDLIKRLQPDRFADIVALVALFRPGPLQSGMVDDFIDRKHGRAVVVYPHPDLEPVLEPTYGIILYQEQVMQIAQILAGYTLGGADLLRRAMGKKKAEEMAKQRSVFTDGAIKRGVDAELATYIFDLMEKFAGYGFNRSHSAAYALLSYQTAWLKAHYPAEFMAAVLSSDMDKTEKIVVFIDECRSLELPVISPTINASQFHFTANQQGQIIYGLGAIKGVGEGAIEGLLKEREKNGLFRDLFDVCRRADLRKVNRRVMEALIRAGAFDELGDNRATLMAQLPEALKLAEQNYRDDAAGQNDLFGLPQETVRSEPSNATTVAVAEWDEERRLKGEKETLGLYLTGHPIDRYTTELQHFISGRLADVNLENGHLTASPRDYRKKSEKRVTIAGLVVAIRTRNANRGGRMAFMTLDDRSARMEIRVFPEVYEKYRYLIKNDIILVVEGALSWDEYSEELRLNAEQLLDLDAARNVFAKRLVLQLHAQHFGNGLLDHLAETLAPYRPGHCPVWVDYTGTKARADIVFGADWQVTPADTLLRSLRELVGEQHVNLIYP